MGFENRIINSLDRRSIDEHPVIIEMHKKAIELLRADAIDPSSFSDLYGQDSINRDLAHIAEIKKNFEHDGSKRASEVLEAILYQHTELSDWLGPNAETIRPSEYDDIKNGVDLVAEFNIDDFTKHLALGVDVTFGSHSIAKKFDRIKREIDADELAQVKYFESHGFKGSLRQLPRVVIGVEKNTVIELASLWMRHKNTELGAHFAKGIIITEITEQLEVLKAYAEKHDRQNAVKSYNQALRVIGPVQELSRQFSREQREKISGDTVHQVIRGHLSEKFSG